MVQARRRRRHAERDAGRSRKEGGQFSAGAGRPTGVVAVPVRGGGNSCPSGWASAVTKWPRHLTDSGITVSLTAMSHADEQSAAAEPAAPSNGPPEGLSYAKYLRLSELISLQCLASDPPAHDELLFIIVHQSYELWFKQILFELEHAREALFGDHAPDALHWFARVEKIERLLVQQVDVIESMLFSDFLEFRAVLKPASGFQSVQFREIEAISGLKEPRSLKMAETDEERTRLMRRLDEPTLWEAFCVACQRARFEMPAEDDQTRHQSLLRLMRQRRAHPVLHSIAESLISHDSLVSMWRWRHVLMVERQIGAKIGTGGSAGAAYLRSTMEKRFYPDLWDMRSDYLES